MGAQAAKAIGLGLSSVHAVSTLALQGMFVFLLAVAFTDGLAEQTSTPTRPPLLFVPPRRSLP